MPQLSEQQQVPSDLVLAFARLNRRALGAALGTVSGLLVFSVTIVAAMRGHTAASALALLAQFLPGYTVTVSGAFIGLGWASAIGYALGWGFALLRNLAVWLWLVVIRSGAEMEQYADLLDHL